jgi:Peptidase family M23
MKPVPGRVTVPYWERGAHWAGGHHRGVDFAAPVGTPVVAPWSGTVTPQQWGPAYGTHTVIDFDRLPDGSPGLWGILAHLSRLDVKPGQRVHAGQTIGRTGATGNVTGPHLHFEVQTNASWRPASWSPEASRDPQPWIDAQETLMPANPPAYRNIKVTTDQVIPLNRWVDLDLGFVDAILPPVGSNDWWFQIHLQLASATVARNDLRYIKGRWARRLSAGDDTHGTDTKTISPDIPKDSWQSAFSTDMKGLTGVPVAAQVYIGAVKDGTIVSPMRLFTIDDETT